MVFNAEGFKKAKKEKKLSYQDIIEILYTKYNIEITLDGIKAYGRKNSKTTPSPEKIKALAEILGVTTDYLLNKETEILPVVSLKVSGTVSCGLSDINHLQTEETIYIPRDIYNNDLYALKACGDSMLPEIADGDTVIVDPNANIKNGDLVVYTLLGEKACKIYNKIPEANIIELIPFNQSENFRTKIIRLDDDHIEDLQIHKVVHIVKNQINNASARLKMVGR